LPGRLGGFSPETLDDARPRASIRAAAGHRYERDAKKPPHPIANLDFRHVRRVLILRALDPEIGKRPHSGLRSVSTRSERRSMTPIKKTGNEQSSGARVLSRQSMPPKDGFVADACAVGRQARGRGPSGRHQRREWKDEKAVIRNGEGAGARHPSPSATCQNDVRRGLPSRRRLRNSTR